MNEKKFIVGNWYKSEWGNYFKFREYDVTTLDKFEDLTYLIKFMKDKEAI